MELSVKQVKALLRRRGALVAAVSALALLVYRAIAYTVSFLISNRNSWGFDSNLFPGQQLWDMYAQYLLGTALPFAIGVFLCLWLLLPIAAELEMRFVVTRGLAAAGVGTVVAFLSTSVIGVVQYVTRTGFYAEISVLEPVDFETSFALIENELFSALAQYLGIAPVVILFTIFQWQWLKNHPPKYEVSGILDV